MKRKFDGISITNYIVFKQSHKTIKVYPLNFKGFKTDKDESLCNAFTSLHFICTQI